MRREDLIRTGDARVASIEMDAFETSPRHFHSNVVENVICLSGRIALHFGEDDESVVLSPGQRYELAAGTTHRLVNADPRPSTYLLVQNGAYDFVFCDS